MRADIVHITADRPPGIHIGAGVIHIIQISLGRYAKHRLGIIGFYRLIYSGNFLAQVEVDSWDTTRVTMGINPFQFDWKLEPGEHFQTPEAIMVYSTEGLNGMSQTFHKLYRTRLARGTWRDKVRPILINSWEAFYFDFDAPKLLGLADAAADLGMELFVLDDGWFGKRKS